MTEWHGDNPYCLVIISGHASTLIDLDEPQWATKYAALMRAEGQWILARKRGSAPVLTVLVRQGEQPYYTSKVHTSFLPPPEFFTGLDITIDPSSIKELSQIRSYGIGKKHEDGSVERLWVLPNGVVCGGEDVEVFGADLVRSSLADVVSRLRSQHGRDNGQSGSEERGPRSQEAGFAGSQDSGPRVH